MDSLHWIIPKFTVPTWMDVLVAIIICIVGWLIQRFIIKKIINRLVIFLRNRHRNFQANVLAQFSKAIGYAFMTAVIVLSLSYLIEVPLFTHKSTKNFVLSIMVFFAFKGVYDVLNFYTKQPLQLTSEEDQNVLLPFFLRIGKVLIMIFAMFTIASFWNFNLNGFLTGIGLTGVAIAFGIRDTLAHVFGGMSVALDNPFQIGDWIATEDQKIEGTIEDINLRSTLIQTGDKGLVYVPNSYLVNRPIYNLSRREKRKCEQYLYVAATNEEDTIRSALTAIHKEIYLHANTEKDMIHVYIDEFHYDRYRVLIRFFVATNDTAVMLEVRQEIFFAIRQIVEELSITLAAPEDDEGPRKKK
ncbi:mechanosensitive ion channel family protein [Lysinibacillus sp. fkY74-1]|uniref:Mechanosensitive ion channel MscS n=2 Tax=Lysinibacillus TaxID=400634 RepID=W7S454_LYSSH|nr:MULTISPECIES: mechanosensitive ion channel domain-containing protein [Lysinibacillus]MBE5083091.1 mechanosensitive ion channel [Bacillus thuringiensis]AMO32956.1 mechanosensitive ion channel protein MscS [Lysinibacillus sphaericus]AMR91941.1 mechanosensitive ion channel protein MscS [Lysinibacillus sphaericus]ANA45989.1 mechanosensitive ion channel protein MscS [Lysinibacillus sphaericus]EWH33041.1 mechanosensitive ion channel MscS [Lysinibacillus sphaericus CBAM5]